MRYQNHYLFCLYPRGECDSRPAPTYNGQMVLLQVTAVIWTDVPAWHFYSCMFFLLAYYEKDIVHNFGFHRDIEILMATPPQPLPRVLAANEIVPAMERVIAQIQAVVDKIIQTVTPGAACFNNVVQPLAEVHNHVQENVGMIYMLFYATPDKAAHDATVQAKKLYREAEAGWALSEDMFRLLNVVRDKDEPLDTEAKVYLEQELREFIGCGHGNLDRPGRERYLQAREEINNLMSSFTQNLMSEEGGIWFTQEELDGVPIEDIARWKDALQPLDGKIFVPFSNGGSESVIAYARSPETRKRMYVDNGNKVAQNAAILREVVTRRDSQARMIGYSSHAAFRMAWRSVRSTEWVDTFLAKTRDGLLHRGKQELKELQRWYNRDNSVQSMNEPEDVKGFPACHFMYYKRQMEEELQIDKTKISEFFPVFETAAAMLDVFASFLGLRFTEIPSEKLTADAVWHKDIRVFSVWDEQAPNVDFVGYIYFDLLYRELKYQGFQSVNVQSGYLKANTRQYPSTILMCSFPTGTPDSPPLLKHDRVVTLFHELGHGIHDLLSRTRYANHHGTKLPVDFGEAPSIMLENWCWMGRTLERLSCHYTTIDVQYLARWREKHPGAPDPPKKIPQELLDNLIKGRNLNRALWFLGQTAIALFDMHIHNPGSHEDIEKLDLGQLWYDIREELLGQRCDPRGHDYVTFPHLLHGYDAGYYGYLSSHVFGQDIFRSVFMEDPEDRNAWERYRRGILQPGGSSGNELKMLEEFLGRPPNLNALLESLE